MEDVLCAAPAEDIFDSETLMFANSRPTLLKSPQDRMEHLLGLMLACVNHKLQPLLDRGDPKRLKLVFGEIAKEWKKFFEPGKNITVYNISDDVRKLANMYCKAFQSMLKEGATKYNFNYIHIPRPAQSKALLAKRKPSNNDDEDGDDGSRNNKNLKRDENESVAKKPASLRVDNEPGQESSGKLLRMIAFSKKIEDMEEITERLNNEHVIDNRFLEAEKVLLKHRMEAKPYEADMDERALEGLLDSRGLDCMSGSRDEKLERLLYHVDYFYDDHKKKL